MLVDLCFMADVALSFTTGFYDEANVLVRSHKAIARRYARSWLVVDVLSSVPLDLFSYGVCACRVPCSCLGTVDGGSCR